ncbi:MAG TPA: XRE family transcriptional regulator [Frankiaceae bacterium]|nr:XRE family transcriptional regulator [Frankiaceae bacterium]
MPRPADGTTVAAAFDPARLTLARHAAGLTKKDLAERVGRTPAALTQYELGQTTPTGGVLESCARVLGVPVAFFARGRPLLRLDTSSAHFRSLRSTRAGERQRALADVELVWELAELLAGHVRFPAVDLPASPDRPDEARDPVVAAREVRRRWGLPPGPVPHIVRLLESKGVVVACLGFSDSGRVDAFSCVTPTRPVVVLTADKGSVLRARFNAAHELGHLLLHREVIPGDVRHEREADAFAAELLMPAADIAPRLPRRVDLPALLRLQQQWGTSVSALLYRSRTLGVLGETSYKRAMIRVSQLGWRTHEPSADHPGERPALLARAFDLAATRGLTIGAVAARLQLHPSRVRQLLALADDRPHLSLVPGSGVP